MSKREVRRLHKERMKAKARRLYKTGYHPHEGEQVHPRAHHYADNMTVCSCYGCGNPRKWFKDKTQAENRFDLSAREQEQELRE